MYKFFGYNFVNVLYMYFVNNLSYVMLVFFKVKYFLNNKSDL